MVTLTPQPPAQRRFRVRIPLPVWISILLLIVLTAVTLLADPLSHYEPNKTSLTARLKAPLGFGGSAQHPLGTDALGRDILSRLLHGGQVSIGIAVTSSVIGLLSGVLLGLLAGYVGGWADQIVMYLVDVQLSLPFILLAIVAAIALGNTLQVLIGLAALSTWPYYARLCRGLVLGLREREFIVAARAIGARPTHIMRAHLLPNLLPPLLVLATLNVGRIILLESGLSFLGIGIKAPDPSWGNMIGDGREYLASAWWLAVVPSLTLAVLTIAVGIIGDWLRDLTDVRIST
jgi:peptide/nickel transport system permease protein